MLPALVCRTAMCPKLGSKSSGGILFGAGGKNSLGTAPLIAGGKFAIDDGEPRGGFLSFFLSSLSTVPLLPRGDFFAALEVLLLIFSREKFLVVQS